MRGILRVTSVATIAIMAPIVMAVITALTYFEVGQTIYIGDNPLGVPMSITNKLAPGPVCTAITGAIIRDHLSVDGDGLGGMVRMYYSTRTDNLPFWDGRFLHHAAEATIDGHENLRRKPARHRNVHDLVAYMRAEGYSAAMVSMDYPGWHHAVAVLVNQDGSWSVVDAAMATKTVKGRMNTVPANSWNGDIRQYPDAAGAWIIYQAEKT